MSNKNFKKITSSHWGAFEAVIENGKLVSTNPFKHDLNPNNISKLIPKAVYHKSRIKRPSIRKGWLQDPLGRSRHLRGNDDFYEVPWDEAVEIASNEIKRIKDKYGNKSIYGGSYGWSSAGKFHHAQTQLQRFLNSIGGYVGAFGSYSTAAAQVIIPHILGMNFLQLIFNFQNTWPTIEENTKNILMFGGINPNNSKVSMGGSTRHENDSWFKKFTNKKINLINISPQKSDAPSGSSWLPIIPGTDTAFMLGLAYELESKSLVDRDFLKKYTVGYEKFKLYLIGQKDDQPKNAEWAENICGVSAETIRSIATKISQERTLITVSWSLQRAQNGEQPYWMATTLAAMLGQIGLPGGGIGFGYGAIGGVGNPIKNFGGLSFPKGKNPITDYIPVARIAEMLNSPGSSYEFNGEKRIYPDIKLIYWCGGNPFHHHQDLNRFHKAWQKPDTIIVNEPWWTSTAKRADIVFPATTSYEREDIGKANGGDNYIFHMPKLIEPVGESKNDYTIFSELSQKLGCHKEFTEGKKDIEWIEQLYNEFQIFIKNSGIDCPSLDELKDKSWITLPVAGKEFASKPFQEFRSNPEEKPLQTPSGKIEIFSETIDSFSYSECPGHPIWIEPDEWLGSKLTKKFPYHLVSPQPIDKLHSQLECAISDIPNERPTPIMINTEDAKELNIKNGEVIRIQNSRGSCLARALLSNEIKNGVLSLPTGAWFDTDEEGVEQQGNPNALTFDKGTSRLGQGPSAHTTLVNIVKEK